jgi:dienelactone hydrolase
LKIEGTIYQPLESPAPWRVVILLHMLWGDRSSWDDFARQLSEAGYVVLVIDMRGHCETCGELDWDKAATDILEILVISILTGIMIQNGER